MSLGSQISFADRWFLYLMLSDSISDRIIAVLLLYNSYIYCAVGICSNKANVPADLIARRATLL